MLLRFWKVNTILMILLMLLGCASVPSASKEDRTVALQFTPPANKSYIYIMRPGRFAGSAKFYSISLDGQIAGALTNDTFIFFEVQPGRHEIVTQLTDDASGAITKNLVGLVSARLIEAATVDCVLGKSYFFATRPDGANIVLRSLPEEEGRRYVTKYDMVFTSHKPSRM